MTAKEEISSKIQQAKINIAILLNSMDISRLWVTALLNKSNNIDNIIMKKN